MGVVDTPVECFVLFTGIIGSTANISLLASLARTSHLHLRFRALVYTACTAALMIAVYDTIYPSYVLLADSVLMSPIFCLLLALPDRITKWIFALSTLALSADRLNATLRHFSSYAKLAGKKIIIFVCVGIWLAALLIEGTLMVLYKQDMLAKGDQKRIYCRQYEDVIGSESEEQVLFVRDAIQLISTVFSAILYVASVTVQRWTKLDRQGETVEQRVQLQQILTNTKTLAPWIAAQSLGTVVDFVLTMFPFELDQFIEHAVHFGTMLTLPVSFWLTNAHVRNNALRLLGCGAMADKLQTVKMFENVVENADQFQASQMAMEMAWTNVKKKGDRSKPE